MPFIVRIRSLFRNLFRSRYVEADLDQEIRSHLDLLIDENIRAGMSPKEALRVARFELGGIEQVKDKVRADRIGNWLRSVLSDCRYALRQLSSNPGFTTIAILTLALGIGANTAMFSFSDAILLRPLPVAHPAKVLTVANTTPEKVLDDLSYPDYRDLRDNSHSFSELLAYRSTTLGIGISTTAPAQMGSAMNVSGNFFSGLGVVPLLGRAFLPNEGEVAGSDPVAILGYDFWKSKLGGDPSVVGRPLRLNGVQFTIIGVAPKSFPGVDRFFPPSVFIPLSMWGPLAGEREDPLKVRGLHQLSVKGRLRDGVTLESAQQELAIVGQRLEAAYPKTNSNRHVIVRTEFQARTEKEPVQLALVATLMALAGLVLIIACANTAGLMLARSRARSREISVRLSLGARRLRLVRQLMTESLIVALLGGLAGLGLGYGGISFLSTIQIPADIPFVLSLHLDMRVLLFCLLAATASCVFFGLAPALQTTRIQLVPALKSGVEAISARRRTIGRNLLVVSQVALAMVLLIVSGIQLNGFKNMLVMNPGFRTDHLTSMELDPSVVRYSSGQTHDFYGQIVDRVQALPGVASVTLTQSVPLSPDQSFVTVIPQGFQFPKGTENVTVMGAAVDQNYFKTMKVPIVSGRSFTADDRSTTQPVAIVNEEFAKTYWPNQDPIGKRIRRESGDRPGATVVGVAKTGKYLLPWEAPAPYVYLPYEQNQSSQMYLVAESHDDPATLAPSLRAAVHTLDPDQPVYNLRTVASYQSAALANWQVLLRMISTMSLVGLVLAMVGLYGLISFSVSRRTSEIGVRMAIGASRASVLRLVIRQGMALAVAGIAIGGVLAALLVPVLAAALVGLGARNAATFVVVPLSLLAVSIAACYIPARRATRVNPVLALRSE